MLGDRPVFRRGAGRRIADRRESGLERSRHVRRGDLGGDKRRPYRHSCMPIANAYRRLARSGSAAGYPDRSALLRHAYPGRHGARRASTAKRRTWSDLTPAIAWNAATGSDRCADAYRPSSTSPGPQSPIAAGVVVTPKQYRRLAAAIRAQFRYRPRWPRRPRSFGYGPSDVFYAAQRAHYSAVRYLQQLDRPHAARRPALRVGAVDADGRRRDAMVSQAIDSNSIKPEDENR